MPRIIQSIACIALQDNILVRPDPNRTSFIVQNISDAQIISIYDEPGKETQGIYLYPHTWLQFFEEDGADLRWYCYSMTAGSTNLQVIRFFKEPEKPRRPRWW